jgi:hypothetical protein
MKVFLAYVGVLLYLTGVVSASTVTIDHPFGDDPITSSCTQTRDCLYYMFPCCFPQSTEVINQEQAGFLNSSTEIGFLVSSINSSPRSESEQSKINEFNENILQPTDPLFTFAEEDLALQREILEKQQIKLAIARPVERIFPTIAWRNKGTYEKFMGGKLIYRPTKGSEAGQIVMSIAEMINAETLEGQFDLSRCGDVGKYLRISTGYFKKEITVCNKLEVWLMPKFVLEGALNRSAAPFQPIMKNWTSEFGIIWNWEGCCNYAYLVTSTPEDIATKNLYEHFCASKSAMEQLDPKLILPSISRPLLIKFYIQF